MAYRLVLAKIERMPSRFAQGELLSVDRNRHWRLNAGSRAIMALS
jgi:hypothetical protein